MRHGSWMTRWRGRVNHSGRAPGVGPWNHSASRRPGRRRRRSPALPRRGPLPRDGGGALSAGAPSVAIRAARTASATPLATRGAMVTATFALQPSLMRVGTRSSVVRRLQSQQSGRGSRGDPGSVERTRRHSECSGVPSECLSMSSENVSAIGGRLRGQPRLIASSLSPGLCDRAPRRSITEDTHERRDPGGDGVRERARPDDGDRATRRTTRSACATGGSWRAAPPPTCGARSAPGRAGGRPPRRERSCPGIVDTHPHVIHFGADRGAAASTSRTRSRTPTSSRASPRGRATTPKGEWIMTTPVGEPHYFLRRSWRDLAEGRLPDRHVLDRAAPDHPVWIQAWAPVIPNVCAFNSAGLAQARARSRHARPGRARLDREGRRAASRPASCAARSPTTTPATPS